MKRNIFAYLIAFIICMLFIYIELPVLRLDFISLYVTVIIFLGLAGLFMIDTAHILDSPNLAKLNLSLVAFLGIFVLIAPFILSTPLFYSSHYHNLIGDVIEGDFTSDISPISVADIRLVDQDMAMRLGDKKLGEIPALGSIAKLGDFHIQSVDEELFWVAPIVHRDFIKWLNNRSGSTGYIMVSATTPQDVRFIQELNDQPIKIIYQPNAYFNQDLERHLYLNGFINIGLTDLTFEIDDFGEPYWVVTLYEHTIGFNGADAVGVATVHATTGKISSYGLTDAPAWIDRIQPESFITSQLKDWGLYVNGFINATFTEANVVVPTPGTSLVYGDDGKSYWYTGMTSSGADDSTVGFVLVDTRTKETKLYRQPGATEIAAMQSAQGKVQEKNYIAAFPVMYNISGIPTYVMPLKDQAGLIKMVAFVSVEDFSIVGLGETKQLAFRDYNTALTSQKNNITLSPTQDTTNTTGIVTRFNADVQNGNTYYFFTLDTLPNLIFTSTSTVSNQVPLTLIGDKVRITYNDYGNDSIDVITFNNLLLNTP